MEYCDHNDIKFVGHDLRQDNYKRLYERLSEDDKSFAFLRNPYKRVVSAFSYLSEGGMNKGDKQDYEKYIAPYDGFEDFVLNGLEKAQEQIHFKPQKFWISNKKGEIVTDFLGTVDNLEKDLKEFSKEHDFEMIDLPEKNQSEKELSYTPISSSKVSNLYSQDLSIFVKLCYNNK